MQEMAATMPINTKAAVNVNAEDVNGDSESVFPMSAPQPSETLQEVKDHSSSTAFSKQAAQSIAPFLASHIPQRNATFGEFGGYLPPATPRNQSNTKYCYRHRPDLKCRRQANEPSMDQLQNVS